METDPATRELMEHDTDFDLRAVPPPQPKAWRYLLLVLLAVLVAALVVVALGYRAVRNEQTRLVRQLAAMQKQIERLEEQLGEREQLEFQRAEFRARWEKGRFFAQSIALPHSGGEARSVSWADYDRDGDLDALVCSRTNHLYQSNGRSFTDVTSPAGLTGGSRCAFWTDYDGDDDLDLFYSTAKLWANEGGRFEDRSQLLPRYPFSNTEGGGWLDANQDGLPDLMLSDGGAGIHLALNQGDVEQQFRDADNDWGLGREGIGVGNGDFLSIADYNGDGLPDFLYNLGRGVLGRNADGRRYELASEAGVSYASENPWKFGTAFGDYDNDGDLDLFVPQNGRPFLYLNNGNGTFTNIIMETGDLAVTGVDAWSAVWGDVNVDGLLDLIVGYPNAPARLFLNRGNGEMDDETFVSGLPSYRCATSSTGMVLADYDSDGDLDLLVTGERTESGVLVNDWPRQKGQVSLRVRLPSSEAPGAVVRLYDSDKKLLGMRQLGLVQTFSSQGPPEAFFGVRPGKYGVLIQRSIGQLVSQEVEVGGEDHLLEVSLPTKEKPAEGQDDEGGEAGAEDRAAEGEAEAP